MTTDVVKNHRYKFDAALRYVKSKLSDLRTEERRKVKNCECACIHACMYMNLEISMYSVYSVFRKATIQAHVCSGNK